MREQLGAMVPALSRKIIMKECHMLLLLMASCILFGCDAEPPTDTWRWINLADWHAGEKHTSVWEQDFSGKRAKKGWNSKGYDSRVAYQDAMRDTDIDIISRIRKDYGGELIVIPGDTNSGHWYDTTFRAALRSVYPGLSDEEVVRQASHLCYGGLRNAFAEGGYPLMIVAVGDHEIGDNPWMPGNAVTPLVPEFRAGFADVFNEAPVVDPKDPANPRLWTYESNAATSNRLSTDPIGTVPSRPLGTDYEETSFARQYRNVLFVTVDVFRQDDFVTRLGEEGTIVGDCEGAHLQWFRDVLAEAADIASIKHIIVQSHLPVIYPVRKYASSGMMMEHTTDSPFMQAMRDGNVDLYLAGEVHSNTVTLDPESDLVQWVCRGNSATNFSTVDVADDKLKIQTWKNEGDATSDILLGTLIIDKSGGGDAVITTTGLLKPIDPEGLNVHYSFDSIVAEESILTGIADSRVSNTNCGMAFENLGEFSNEYTAWTRNTSVGNGLIKGCVEMTSGKSVLGVSSMGPVSHGHRRTIGMWIRTTSSKRQILFNTTSFWGKSREFFNLSLNNGKFEVMLSKGKMKVARGSTINDGSWHHVAATVPAQGATLDDVKLYIDGVLQTNVKTLGGSSTINTAQANWMGIGILLAQSGFKLDEQLGMTDYEGGLDDFALWTRALSDAETRAVVRGAVTRDYNASEMEQLFALNKAKTGKVTIGKDTWTYDPAASGATGEFEVRGNAITLHLGGSGALVTNIVPVSL